MSITIDTHAHNINILHAIYGGFGQLQDATGIDQRLLSGYGRGRFISPKQRRQIESGCGLSSGWMETRHSLQACTEQELAVLIAMRTTPADKAHP